MSEAKKYGIHEITEPELEGVRDAIKIQLNENVLPYIYKHDMMFKDKDNPVYQEYRTINVDSNKLVKLYVNNELSDTERNTEIANLISELYRRTKDLIILVNSKKQEDDDDTPLKRDNEHSIFPQ